MPGPTLGYLPGTAAIVSPVNAIFYEGREYAVPVDRDNTDAKAPTQLNSQKIAILVV